MAMAAVEGKNENAASGDEATPKPGEGTAPQDSTSQASPNDDATHDGDIQSGDGEGDKPDPRKAADDAKIEAWKAENLAAEVQKELDRLREEAASSQVEADVSEEINSAIKDIHANLQGIKMDAFDKEGKPVSLQLAPDQIEQSVVNRINDLRENLRKVEQGAVYENLEAMAVRLVGADKDEEAAKALSEAVNGKPLNEWFAGVIEQAAPKSKAWAAREKALEAEKLERYAAGWEDAMKAPPGTASMNNSNNVSSGKLTRETFLAMTPDEQVKAWKERPEEVKALS